MRVLTRLAKAIILALVVGGNAPPAQAFFDQPYITPTNPSVGDTIVMNVYGGVCDTIIGEPGFPDITQDGTNIRMLLYGAHYDPGSTECIYGSGTAHETVGSFPPGSYTLEVDMQYISAFGPIETLTIGTVDFQVAGVASAKSVPSLDPTLCSLLAALMGAIGIGSLRARDRQHQ